MDPSPAFSDVSQSPAFRGRLLPSARRRHQQVVLDTPLGITLQGKYQIKAAVQTAFFATLLIGFAVANLYIGSGHSSDYEIDASISSSSSMKRFLQENGKDTSTETSNIPDCADIEKADPGWLAAFYMLGVMYMFLALAICCDEFFVPALEEMAAPHRMNLSMDVAGATLMAAGGSAPELFTSLIGTFRESDIGFGTIVGSATFNVLFVIAMCALLTKKALTLTWWPLFRDCSYYAVGLLLLAIFCGIVTPNEVHLWEATILFAWYIGYCLMMSRNAQLYKALTGKVLVYPDEDEDDDEGSTGKSDHDHPSRASTMESSDPGTCDEEEQRGNLNRVAIDSEQGETSHKQNLGWQGTFRAGILKLLKDPDCWMETAGYGIVLMIPGDVDRVFEQVDVDGNGHVDREELQQLFNLLESPINSQELENVFGQLDKDGDGMICQKEFTEWYMRSEEGILSQVRHVFEKIDLDHSNTINRDDMKTLLTMLDPQITDDDVSSALDAMNKNGSREEITFEEFSEWFKHSLAFDKQKQLIEEEIEGVWDFLRPPKSSTVRDWIWYILVVPLVFVMTLTIPDVTRPGMGKWCYVAFLFSICWIAGFAYLMVDWAEIVGYTVGIPSVVMGYTVLAAGTSIPDLLTSIIVARRGRGDMALSSSVGSNIFDVHVGLALPWMIYTAWPTTPSVITMGAGGLFRNLMVLIGMLVVTVVSIHFQGWKLTKKVGALFFFCYIAFLVQAVVFELPFQPCTI